MNRWINAVAMSAVLSAGVVHAETYPVIQSWSDIEKALPSGHRIVGVIPGNELWTSYGARPTEDATSLTGSTASTPPTINGWNIQAAVTSVHMPIRRDQKHSQFILTKVKKHDVVGNVFSFFAFGGGLPEAISVYDNASLIDETWQLLPVSLDVDLMKQSESAIGRTTPPNISIGAVIYASDYQPGAFVHGYITPNGDGLNDTAEIRQVIQSTDAISIEVMDASGKTVRHVPMDDPAKNPFIRTAWDGKDDAGSVQPEGQYSVRVTINGEAADYPDAILLETIDPWKPVEFGADEPSYFPLGVYHDDDNSVSIPSDLSGAIAWYDEHFRQLAEDGFNTVTVVWPRAERIQGILEAAKKHGIKIVLLESHQDFVKPGKLLTERMAYDVALKMKNKYDGMPDSLVGYLLTDEPPANMVETWVTMQRVTYNVDPTRFALTCMNDKSVVANAAGRTQLHNACVDSYLIRNSSTDVPGLLDAYGKDVRDLHSLSNGRPVWMVAQAFGDGRGGFRDLTVAETRAMMWITLANGGKGLFQFVYVPFNDTFTALLDRDGNRKPAIKELGVINRKLKDVFPLLLKGEPVDLGLSVAKGQQFGQFRTADGQAYFIVMNRDTANRRILDVKVPASFGSLADAATGESISLVNGYARFDLDAGDGRVVLLQNSIKRGQYETK